MENNDEKMVNNAHKKQTQEEDVKNNEFPLSRIKRIMKSDPDVCMVSKEAPLALSKACEMFIQDLTKRSWDHAQENKRSTLLKSDISAAVARASIYEFLVESLPKGGESSAALPAGLVAMPQPAEGGGEFPGMVMGTPVVDGGGVDLELVDDWMEIIGDGEAEAEQGGGNNNGEK
ncbi:unnamed protein product [Cochlearia groenlandica]